ncbi:hypothetical protein VMCG_10913 [Cytospora schulzeri]|uniref:Uncharacterized protein n=1 Tax=Cytospora schulzeri TaxID=448051 RepID=A0A423V7M3_9PEZI|nr:hypothetical protein VMCG_10913 [Valsa malicola]
MGGQLGFMYRQLAFTPKPVAESVKLNGQTAIVTGAGSIGSLGLEAAKEMTAHGLSRLIIAARTVTKAEAARQDVLEVSPSCVVEVWELDYESYPSMKNFARRAQMELDRLDIVVLSAGVKLLEYVKSKAGHEANVQVNHLGTAFLSLALLQPLQRTAKAVGSQTKMTIVTSEVHFWTKFNERKAPHILDRMDDPGSFKKGNMDRYNASKLLNVLWLRELSDRAASSSRGVIINGVNPGLCASSLHRSHQEVAVFNKMFAWSSEEGGHCLADAALQHGEHGAYISEQVVKQPSQFVLSPDGVETQKKIWEETMAILREAVPDMDLGKGLDSSV